MSQIYRTGVQKMEKIVNLKGNIWKHHRILAQQFTKKSITGRFFSNYGVIEPLFMRLKILRFGYTASQKIRQLIFFVKPMQMPGLGGRSGIIFRKL
jgi:hypothetical protein